MMNAASNLIFRAEIVIATYFVRNTDLVMRSDEVRGWPAGTSFELIRV